MIRSLKCATGLLASCAGVEALNMKASKKTKNSVRESEIRILKNCISNLRTIFNDKQHTCRFLNARRTNIDCATKLVKGMQTQKLWVYDSTWIKKLENWIQEDQKVLAKKKKTIQRTPWKYGSKWIADLKQFIKQLKGVRTEHDEFIRELNRKGKSPPTKKYMKALSELLGDMQKELAVLDPKRRIGLEMHKEKERQFNDMYGSHIDIKKKKRKMKRAKKIQPRNSRAERKMVKRSEDTSQRT